MNKKFFPPLPLGATAPGAPQPLRNGAPAHQVLQEDTADRPRPFVVVLAAQTLTLADRWRVKSGLGEMGGKDKEGKDNGTEHMKYIFIHYTFPHSSLNSVHSSGRAPAPEDISGFAWGGPGRGHAPLQLWHSLSTSMEVLLDTTSQVLGYSLLVLRRIFIFNESQLFWVSMHLCN